MAQVPYDPRPGVAPQMNPTPMMGISVPADAFGANVAQAAAHLGKVLDHSGNEIFERGLAMQKLANEAEAKQADADYIIKAGDLHATYQARQGLDAVREYPNHVEALRKLREDASSKLSNPESRRMFDAASLGTMSRTIFSGASHSAGENKKASLGASAARVEAAGNQALTQPADEEMFKQSLGIAEAEVRSQGNLLGWGDDKTSYELRQKTSELWEKRIQGMSKNNPVAAMKMLDEATASGKLSGDANGRIRDYVSKQLYTVGARNISADISSGGNLSFGARVVGLPAAKAAIGGYESGMNYKAVGIEVFNRDGSLRGRALGKYQVMSDNLPKWLAEAGQKPMSEQEFLNNPDAQEAVFEKIFGGYMEKYGSFNEAASRWFTGRSIAEATAKGVADGNGTTTPRYLANTNAILAKNASLAERVAVGRKQAEEIAPNDKLFPDYTQDRITTDYRRDVAIKRDDEWRNQQTVVEAINGDKSPTTPEELKAISPEVASAYDASSPTKQMQYNKWLGNNAKDDVPWTPEMFKEKSRQLGMSQTDPVAFLNQDISEMEIPKALKGQLINLQAKIKKDASGDPRLNRAVTLLQSSMEAANITPRDKDAYYRFKGALWDALTEYREEHKKEASAEEVQKIGSRLLQLQSGSGWFGTNFGRVPFYTIPVPSDVLEKVQANDAKLGQVPRTPQQIQRDYTRELYNKLYGKPKVTP